MRILLAGATGVLGRATLPHLRQHDVVGLTRSEDKLSLLADLGAEGVLCDVYDYDGLLAVAQGTRPEAVVNFVTDLADDSAVANARVRREGGANLLRIAAATKASRLVVESIAFTLEGDAANAVAELERSAETFPGDSLILRFGLFWGPGTHYDSAPSPSAVHVGDAGARAAPLITDGTPGVHTIV
jgi:nucleoside-diphosphate-sugar epimerase